MSTTVKSQRINLRASERQEALIRQAAEVTDSSVSDFILSSATERAEHVLADHRWFVATEEQYDLFVQALEAPARTEKLERLFARESPVGKEIVFKEG